MATSLIARSLFWFKSRMEFAFWDCGDIQALVAVQSGEFCIVHGNGLRNVSAVGLGLSEKDCCTDLQRRCAPQISSSGMWRVAATWL